MGAERREVRDGKVWMDRQDGFVELIVERDGRLGGGWLQMWWVWFGSGFAWSFGWKAKSDVHYERAA